jgi:hypothetical protein
MREMVVIPSSQLERVLLRLWMVALVENGISVDEYFMDLRL